jgi:hypothetical protein
MVCAARERRIQLDRATTNLLTKRLTELGP